MTTLLLTLAICGQAAALPTGVIPEGLPRELPHRSAYKAYGPVAAAFIAETFAPADQAPMVGDDRIPTGGKPWVVLIGPDAETSQAEGQIPGDLRPLVEVRRYTPDDPRLDRGLKAHYQGGTFALLLRPDGQVHWKGLVAMTELLRQINRLLGREPEPSPWDPLPIPFPIPNGPSGGASVVSFVSGVVFGWVLLGGLWAFLAASRWLGAIQAKLDRLDAAPAPQPPPASPPNG